MKDQHCSRTFRTLIHRYSLKSFVISLVLVIGFCQCSKTGRDLTYKNQLIEKMVNDPDVLAFIEGSNKYTKGLLDQMGEPKERMMEHMNDTSYHFKAKTMEEVQQIVTKYVKTVDVKLIAQKAAVVNTRYNLSKYTPEQLKEIYEQVFNSIAKRML